MAVTQSLHTDATGTGIQDLSTGKVITHTTGATAPAGTGAQANYEIGSTYVAQDTGVNYVKETDNGNSADWVAQITTSSLSATLANLSGLGLPFTDLAITTITTVDTVLVDNVRQVAWDIVVQLSAETGFHRARVTAWHDGTSAADAVNAGFVVETVNEWGTAITGLVFGAALAGATTTQTLGLTITSTSEVAVAGVAYVLATLDSIV